MKRLTPIVITLLISVLDPARAVGPEPLLCNLSGIDAETKTDCLYRYSRTGKEGVVLTHVTMEAETDLIDDSRWVVINFYANSEDAAVVLRCESNQTLKITIHPKHLDFFGDKDVANIEVSHRFDFGDAVVGQWFKHVWWAPYLTLREEYQPSFFNNFEEHSRLVIRVEVEGDSGGRKQRTYVFGLDADSKNLGFQVLDRVCIP